MKKMTDEFYMRRALQFARKGLGLTSPNPSVGATLVKNGKIVAEDYHHRAGEPHAEALVLKKAGKKALGGTLFVTLEPCTHWGKTPPCTDAIIKSGVKKVIFAVRDPNPINTGKGKRFFGKHGIKVIEGICGEEARMLNQPFFKFTVKKLPHVTMKVATTLDGKIATRTGKSKWITGEEARMHAHKLRKEHDAVLVGINTVLKDDPHLGVRYIKGRDPLRVILDSRLRIPSSAKVLRDKNVLIFTTVRADAKKIKFLKKRGYEVAVLKNQIRPREVLKELAKRNILSVLIEGGSQIYTSFMKEKLIDRVAWFIAPKVMCDSKAIPVFSDDLNKHEHPLSAKIKHTSITLFQNDVCIEGYLNIYR